MYVVKWDPFIVHKSECQISASQTLATFALTMTENIVFASEKAAAPWRNCSKTASYPMQRRKIAGFWLKKALRTFQNLLEHLGTWAQTILHRMTNRSVVEILQMVGNGDFSSKRVFTDRDKVFWDRVKLIKNRNSGAFWCFKPHQNRLNGVR